MLFAIAGGVEFFLKFRSTRRALILDRRPQPLQFLQIGDVVGFGVADHLGHRLAVLGQFAAKPFDLFAQLGLGLCPTLLLLGKKIPQTDTRRFGRRQNILAR